MGTANIPAVKAANCRGERFLAEGIEEQCDKLLMCEFANNGSGQSLLAN
jgi:hypothetical protein